MRAFKRVMWVVGMLLAAYAAFAAFAYYGQRKLLYPAPKSGARPVMEGANITEVMGAHGRTVYAMHVPAPKGAPTVVHFHGNGEELADLVPLAWAFRRAGLGFFAVEYPGYGMAKAFEPSEEAIYADAEAALWHLHNGLGVPTTAAVLEGQSLGTGVAIEMALRGHGARLVLISPFTSIPEVASRHVPLLPVRWLMRDHFDNAAKAKLLSMPVLIVHGTDDEVIPFAMGEELSHIFPSATLYKVPGGHHNDLFVRDGRVVTDRIAEFARGDFGGR